MLTCSYIDYMQLTCGYIDLQEVLVFLVTLVYLHQGALDEGRLDIYGFKDIESIKSVQFCFVDLK